MREVVFPRALFPPLWLALLFKPANTPDSPCSSRLGTRRDGCILRLLTPLFM